MAENKPTIHDFWQDLLDKSDRTSPSEYPDMALITYEEFRDYLTTFSGPTWPGDRPAEVEPPQPPVTNAHIYANMPRADLCGGSLTDEQAAYTVAMLMRGDLNHEVVLTIGKDRIRWLSTYAAGLEKMIAAKDAALRVMLAHSCVSDAAPDDKFEEDHAAERMARAALPQEKANG
jgi:hypothetical protein